MSLSEDKKELLSQLVDGELPVDEANRVLTDVFNELTHVLGNAEAGRYLHEMLQLRQALGSWRRQEPPRAVVALPSAPDELLFSFRRGARTEGRHETEQSQDTHTPALSHALSQRERGPRHRLSSLVSAALLGGILVAGGFFLGGRSNVERPIAPTVQQPVVIVTPEDRREIARAFALHESVAGPLSWYAADDATIQVAPAGKGESLRQPIAVLLRLTRDVSCPSATLIGPKTYVIVCRNNDAATIELPQSGMAKTIRLRLLPTTTNGEVHLQYAIAADGSDSGPDGAALAGRRDVALGQTSLGQLAMSNCLVNVDASAWVITN